MISLACKPCNKSEEIYYLGLKLKAPARIQCWIERQLIIDKFAPSARRELQGETQY